MWRVSGCRFRCWSSTMPSTSGSPRSSTIASGRYSSASARAGLARGRAEHAVAAARAASSSSDAKRAVVLHHQQHAVARRDAPCGRRRARRAATARARRAPGSRRRRRRAPSTSGAGGPAGGSSGDRDGPSKGSSSVKVRALAAARSRRQRAAEQPRHLARDVEPQARAAVAAAGGAVGLLEGLEDQRQLVRRDADAGVEHRERREPLGPRRAVAVGQALGRDLVDAQRHGARRR